MATEQTTDAKEAARQRFVVDGGLTVYSPNAAWEAGYLAATETISTSAQVVTVKTRRGNLRVGPHGRIDGLWRIIERELRTNEQVREMCSTVKRKGGRPSTRPIEKHTLRAWRDHQQFPQPVVRVGRGKQPLELWSRTEVEDWLARRATETGL